MFTTQMNYWNNMMEKIQENYKTSLTSGQKFQEDFSNFLRDMIENNYKSTMNYQKELQKISQKMIDSSMDDMGQFSKFYSDNLEYTMKAMNSISEKYSIKNDEFKKEMEQVWKENVESFRKKMDETVKMVNNTQQKNVEMMFDVFKSFSEKGMQELSKRMENISKTK
jgi:hypothetical protein